MQESYEGKHQRIGPTSQKPHGNVCGEQQRDNEGKERPKPGWNRCVLTE
jgi:hypothetical protein